MKKIVSIVSVILLLCQICLGQFSARPITLESIWIFGEYYPDYPSEFRWMQDDKYYSVLEVGQGIGKYSVENERRVDEVLDFTSLDQSVLAAKDIASYDFSPSESYVLLKSDIESIYRRSSKEYCFVVSGDNQQLLPIHPGHKITNASFSPNENNLAFVFENNLYLTDLRSGKEIQITFDGKQNEVINGLTDWVYEEEFAFVDAFRWSPNGRYLAFYRFDETHVNEFNIPIYEDLYPQLNTFKYPKAGEDNSFVSIHIYDLQNQKTTTVDIGSETDQYIPRIKWTWDNELALMRMNRLQNQLDVLLADPKTGDSWNLLREVSDTYIREATDDKWYFLENGDMIWMSEKDGFNHLYRLDSNSSKLKPITSGSFDVDELVGIDELNDRIYYLSTEDSPLERHLYCISLKGKKKRKLTTAPGMHEIEASSSFRYFVDLYSTTTQLPITELKNNEGETIKVLENNQRLSKKMDRLDLAQPEFYSFSTPDGVDLNGWMIKPTDFDANRKYPVLMFVYGGPGDQKVVNSWGHGRSQDYMWFQMLAQQGYIVSCIDNRGTGGRGRDFRAITYGQLGKYETYDQIEAAKYLQKQSYVDPDRIGIWGWSYGGYMTSLCMSKGRGVFKAGIAVAPVTNWRFYDTIYTERYLKRPQDNPKGYDNNSPINFAKDLQGAYLLIHGTGDDNVHVQNSMEWVNALIKANKQFEMFFYPNRRHGITGGITRFHLYQKMTDFLLNNL
ncbi:MAG: S9 family peptidase [Bacteroidota bacterium]